MVGEPLFYLCQAECLVLSFFVVAASSLLERTSSAFDILIARQSTSSGIDPSEIPTQVHFSLPPRNRLLKFSMDFSLVRNAMYDCTEYYQCKSVAFAKLPTISELLSSPSEQACTTDSCICTTTNADEMESCVNCLVSIDPTADMIEEGNEILLCK